MLMGFKAAVCCAIVAAAQAATSVPAPSPVAPAPTDPVVAQSPAPPAGYVRVPANTVVDFEIADALSSKTSKIDEMFGIRLVDPVMVDGAVLLPAGTMGEGQIVHAAKARALGKAGELILAARFFSCGEAHLALRGFHLGHSGKNNATELAIAISAIGAVALPLMFVSGGESIVPSGTRANARFTSAVDLRAGSGTDCAALPVEKPVSAEVSAPAPPVATARKSLQP